MRCCWRPTGPAVAGFPGRASWPAAPDLPRSCCCAAPIAAAARDAAALGVFSVTGEDLEHEGFIRVLIEAEQRQAHARALWRSSSAGRETQRFGDAFVRDYRCIRKLANGATTDLYLAESERAGALVVLKVARDRRDERDQPIDAFRRFLQEYEIAQRIDSPAVVRLHDLGVSDEHAWLVMEYFPAVTCASVCASR